MIFEGTGLSHGRETVLVISDEIKILEILFLTAGRIKDSQKLSTIRIVCIGKENDIWDSDERSLGCGILVEKRIGNKTSGPPFQNLLNHYLLLNALINISLKPFSGGSLQMESKTV